MFTLMKPMQMRGLPQKAVSPAAQAESVPVNGHFVLMPPTSKSLVVAGSVSAISNSLSARAIAANASATTKLLAADSRPGSKGSEAAALSDEKRSASFTVIYADCNAKKFGDYSGAAALAFAAYEHCNSESISGRFVLASSPAGIEVFKKLYQKKPTDDHLLIHGVQFAFTTLEEIIAKKKQHELAHYVEVAQCAPAEPWLVKQAINPKTRILFVGLPHNPDECDKWWSYNYSQEFSTGRASILMTGLVKNRVGLITYNGAVQPINNADYCNVTTKPFAVVYYFDRPSNAAHFVADFITIARRSSYQCSNYVILGGVSVTYKAVEAYTARVKTNATVMVYDPKLNKKTLFTVSAPSSCKRTEMSGDVLVAHEADAMKVVALEHVNQEQMQALIHGSAFPIVGATGLASPIEVLTFGKTPYMQYLLNNEDFISDYYATLSALLQSDADSASLMGLFHLLLWRVQLDEKQINEVVKTLDDPKLRGKLSKTSLELIKANTGRVAPAFCKALGLTKAVLVSEATAATAAVTTGATEASEIDYVWQDMKSSGDQGADHRVLHLRREEIARLQDRFRMELIFQLFACPAADSDNTSVDSDDDLDDATLIEQDYRIAQTFMTRGSAGAIISVGFFGRPSSSAGSGISDALLGDSANRPVQSSYGSTSPAGISSSRKGPQ